MITRAAIAALSGAAALGLAFPAAAQETCRSFSFTVEIPEVPSIAFAYVDGLEVEVGGPQTRNNGASVGLSRQRLPGLLSSGSVTLGRVVANGQTELFDWFERAARQGEERDITISMLNPEFEPCARIQLTNARPSAYRILPLDADSEEPAMEELDITFTRLMRAD